MSRILAALALLGLANAAIVMIGDVAYDTAKMADAINKKMAEGAECFAAEEGEESGEAHDGDCGCAMDEKEFCFKFQYTDPDYPEDGAEEDFRCAQLPAECGDVADKADEEAAAAKEAGKPDSPGGEGDKQPGDNDDLCCWWASCGECNVNPSYMQKQCSGSCASGSVCTAQPPSPNCAASKAAYQGRGQPKAAADPAGGQPQPQAAQKPFEGVIGAPSLPGNAQPPPMGPQMPGANAGAETTAVPTNNNMGGHNSGWGNQGGNSGWGNSNSGWGHSNSGWGSSSNNNNNNQGGWGRTSNQGQAGCSNRDDLCEYWNSIGECSRNGKYMQANCRKACGMC